MPSLLYDNSRRDLRLLGHKSAGTGSGSLHRPRDLWARPRSAKVRRSGCLSPDPNRGTGRSDSCVFDLPHFGIAVPELTLPLPSSVSIEAVPNETTGSPEAPVVSSMETGAREATAFLFRESVLLGVRFETVTGKSNGFGPAVHGLTWVVVDENPSPFGLVFVDPGGSVKRLPSGSTYRRQACTRQQRPLRASEPSDSWGLIQ